ncbi:MAG: hypothetical protein WBX01_00760 [Nitrososphaeraceae archaeon]
MHEYEYFTRKCVIEGKGMVTGHRVLDVVWDPLQFGNGNRKSLKI